MKKIFKAAAIGINLTTLLAMVAVGAFYWTDAQAEQRLLRFTDEELYCLQQNIYFEARNQSVLGQRAVAWVTLNRMDDHRYPNTVCDVVWQPKQFSWTHDGKADTPGTNAIEQKAWKRAGLIARSVISKWAREHTGPVEDAVMFHAEYVSPFWTDHYVEVAQIDTHIFYR